MSLPLALALVVVGCDGGGGGGSSLATVSGRVLDDLGDPVASAQVEIASEPVSVTTDAQGQFLVQMEAGSHHLQVSANGFVLCQACFTVQKRESFDLGDLYPGRPDDCGGPMFCAGDTDCDGIPDVDEMRGWEVRVVLGDGVTEVLRWCSSDPTRKDTDGDGLSDLEELAARTDPSRRDTDGDLLPDFGELNSYKSNPCRMDSDGDSRGPDGLAISDPNLWDGFELRYLRTSPTLADTDGDGLSDWEEVHSGGTDPRIADLPAMDLELYGDPALILDVTIDEKQEAIESTLEKDSDSYEKTDTESTKMSIENTVKIHTETKAGTGTWPPSFNATVTTDTEFKHGYFTESMSSWTESSVQESQQTYESQAKSVTSWDDGRLAVAIRVANRSDLSFKVKDLRITAYRQGAGGSFSPVGNLVVGDGFDTVPVPDSDPPRTRKVWNAYPDHEFILGPGAVVTLLVGADSLPTQIMRALVANPTALLFEVGSYSLFQLDDLGVNETVNFAKLGEDVIQHTGLIVVDYGNGTVERYMVATNVFRHPDGSGRGLTLGEALGEVIGLSYETALGEYDEEAYAQLDPPQVPPPARRVLTRVRTREQYAAGPDDPVRGFWVVGGNSPLFDEPLTVDFDDIVLRAGERVSLTYVEDRDGDGLFDREEALLGTDPTVLDTDADGIDDYDEAKVGWEVAVYGRTPYRVYPDARFFDLDGDYLSDRSEQLLGTDPYLADTDGDEDHDAFDSDPLRSPCLGGTGLNLANWWDATVDPGDDMLALDVWGDQHANMSSDTIAYLLDGSEPVFYLNPGIDQRDQYLSVPSGGISPTREYTIAAWVMWQGVAASEDWGTVLTKGPGGYANYALFLSRDGVLRQAHYRRVHEQCWFWGDDWSCADDYYNSWETLDSPAGTISEGIWMHVTATFANDWMRLYVDGQEVGARQTSRTWWTGLFDDWEHYKHTEYLITNAENLTIGVDPTTSGSDPADDQAPFRGYLDDVQTFYRALTADEIRQLYGLGVCCERIGSVCDVDG